ncbi:MAG: hypothetical protein WA433_01910 [Desulfobaccales bacterium]
MKFSHDKLDALARKVNPNFCRWFGISAGRNQHWYRCRICRELILRKAAGEPLTPLGEAAILEHRQKHLEQLR